MNSSFITSRPGLFRVTFCTNYLFKSMPTIVTDTYIDRNVPFGSQNCIPILQTNNMCLALCIIIVLLFSSKIVVYSVIFYTFFLGTGGGSKYISPFWTSLDLITDRHVENNSANNKTLSTFTYVENIQKYLKLVSSLMA